MPANETTTPNNEKDSTTGINHAGKSANPPLKILTASSICGDRVFNTAGERLGKIKDIMLNLEDGTMQYVVIRFGGFLGMFGKYFAVPFDALTIDVDRRAFILDQSLASFEVRPGFDKDHWPQANMQTAYRSRVKGGFMGANTGSDH